MSNYWNKEKTPFDDAKEEIMNKIYEMAKNPLALKYKAKEIHDYYSELMSLSKFREGIYGCIK